MDAIIIENLSKQYRRYSASRPFTLQEAVLSGFRWMRPEEHFWALKDVSFQVPLGKMVGVIGANGAGKSTLLRLIGGVGRPDKGRIKVSGRVGALIDLGAGFHQDLTGRENIFVNGIISGLTRQEVKQRFMDIVHFSELEEFIDYPLRTYSTGMQMRLGFSIAAHIDPDILLIDEVLAVGDIAFQQKCLGRISEFRSRGCAILLVSHDTGLVNQICDEVIWLKGGQIMAQGPTNLVVNQYIASMRAETLKRTPKSQPTIVTAGGIELSAGKNRIGSFEVEISRVQLLNGNAEPITELDSGQSLSVEMEFFAKQPIPTPIFGVTIYNDKNTVCYDTSTERIGLIPETLRGQGKVRLHMERLDLVGGLYYIDVGIYTSNWEYAYDYHRKAYPLTIHPTPGEKGVLRPPTRWEFMV